MSRDPDMWGWRELAWRGCCALLELAFLLTAVIIVGTLLV